MPRYAARDDRLASMTDEAVDRYYTCILCQSFAPAHCCVVTPERLGLCGAVSWLDAKATNELDPKGPCQPIFKEECLDERTGRFASVDRAICAATQGAVETVTPIPVVHMTIPFSHSPFATAFAAAAANSG